MRKRFLIPSLVAAGIVPVPMSLSAAPGRAPSSGDSGPDDVDAIVQRFAQHHGFSLAQHRSHSSHASHSSHRSGTSGRVRAPSTTTVPRTPSVTPAPAPSSTRNSRSTPPSSILPSSPATAPQSLYQQPAPSRSQIENVVRQVQIGLIAYGYYQGPPDGMVGPKTRDALTRFQTDFNLKVTGTITPEVLDAFKITTP